MSTTTLFKKHFPSVYGGAGVGIFHPNMESFFEELNKECLAEDEEMEVDFERCSDCDGHDACEDFGCAIKTGIIKKPVF